MEQTLLCLSLLLTSPVDRVVYMDNIIPCREREVPSGLAFTWDAVVVTTRGDTNR